MRFRLRRKTKRFFKRLLLSSPLFFIGWFFYLLLRSPSAAPAATIIVELTPERIERGQYLFDAVCACGTCHSERDYKKFGAPIDPKGNRARAILRRCRSMDYREPLLRGT